ncbi:hypothetical protein ACERK3_04765 [Phycisphaerales bacterium AB-hyl4]|uniref:Uncharacterized protein n=1 Tax=Natronomicrosphaera hydrolytica TaxID=3242702 RepID=A0ABV4U3W9_9BACT
MTIRHIILLLCLLVLLTSAGAFIDVTVLRADHYSPGNYETAFQIMIFATGASLLAIITATLTILIGVIKERDSSDAVEK